MPSTTGQTPPSATDPVDGDAEPEAESDGTAGWWHVLDLSSTLGGAYCSRLLAAAGATIVRVESPDGHPLRRWSASGSEIADDNSGALFKWLAGGQRAVSVDPHVPDDVAALSDWISSFDAVLWTPGSPLTAAGAFDVDRIAATAPRAVVTAITPFGLDGPWSDRVATEFTLQAMSGGPALRGSRAWPPMSSGGQHGEWMIGVFSAVATLVGLRRQLVSGQGGVLDVSSLESVLMTQLFNPITMEMMEGGVRPRRPKAKVADVAPSKDGYVGFAVVNRLQHWHDFCAMIEQYEWAEDRDLDPPANRDERCDELNKVIHAWTTERTTAEIVELATLMRIPATAVGNGETIPKMDHFARAGFYDTNPDGGFLQPAPPFRMHPRVPGIGECRTAPRSAPPIRTVERPSRTSSRRKDESSGTTGTSGSASTPAAPGGDSAQPFAGIRIADFTSFWAGPFLTHTLGMFGADIIHIESTTRPDGARLMNHHAPPEPKWWEWSSYFQATNTNKRGITLDMSTDEGRSLAHRIVAECDVVVENYSPRVLESWGLSWDDVNALNPRAIMVRMPAFGLSGPWRDRTGFAMTMEQVSGMAWLTGFPEHEPGALFGPCDPGAGLHASIGLMAALEARRHTGRGMLVEAPMVASALNVAGEQVVEHSAYGQLLSRTGNRGPAAAPQNCYRCSDPDPDGVEGQRRWVAIAVASDQQWQTLCRALGNPDWANRPALSTMAGRQLHHDDIDSELRAWCAERTSAEAAEQLWLAGVPAAPVVHPSEQLKFEQLRSRRFFETVQHPVSGETLHVTYPFRLPGVDGPVHRQPAPTLGQHTADVLRELLGLSDDQIDALRTTAVIGDEIPG